MDVAHVPVLASPLCHRRDQAETVWESFRSGEKAEDLSYDDSDFPSEALEPGSAANNKVPDECLLFFDGEEDQVPT